MTNWSRYEFAERMGFGNGVSHRNFPAIIAKTDIDPATRGMMAAISSTMLDGMGGTDHVQLKYWYRRQNGQAHLVHLFEIRVTQAEENDETIVEEIYYRNKPLIGHLPPHLQTGPREILLDAIKEINLHLREGGSPKSILSILEDYHVEEIVGESIVLPGQNAKGKFNFRIADSFNPVAQGQIKIQNDDNLVQVLMQGEINTLDAHRRIDETERFAYATNKISGNTFRSRFHQAKKPHLNRTEISLEPAINSDGSAKPISLLQLGWKKSNLDENDNFVLRAFNFLNNDISSVDVDTQIRVLGASYKIMDLFRRRRYPTALDILHEFDLLDFFSPIEPPPREGRLSVVSYLGNGKEEIVEGFGFDLGACKAACFEKPLENGQISKEVVVLDLGKMLAPHGSEWDGALPDVIGILKDTKAIFITHRHLDHMASIIELTRLGLLKDKKIYGASRVLYILKNQIKAELDDKKFLPDFEEISGEGIVHFNNIKVEYCVDGMDHSTPSTIYRAVGINDTGKIKGSYLFYGDGRNISKPEFLSRGLRSFGLDRQDTLHDLDLTNAKKPGFCPTEKDAERNLIDLMECFSDKGILTGLISTNDRRLQTLYRVFNRIQRNFTAVGHNVEMSLRAHNIYGVDPEFIYKSEKDNVNQFLKIDAMANDLEPVEYRSRGSNKAKGWLEGNLGKLAVLVTGTQGNPGEMFSTLYRFSEGWSTLDADRHTSFKINDPREWMVIIDQSAIPGNHKYQKKMIDKLLRNRSTSCVAVAIDDGFKIYGLNDLEKSKFIAKYICGSRRYYCDDDGGLIITGAPIHPSGHAYMANITEIAKTANADINHGTHTNDPENTTRFHLDICEKNELRHLGRQFDDFEHNEIEMGDTPEQSCVTSLGHSHSSMIVFKIVREFGKFFGGTLRAKRITKLDGETGFSQYGIFGNSGKNTFEHDVIAVDFANAARQRREFPEDKSIPEDAMMTGFNYERRYRGVNMPKGIRLDEKKKRQIRDLAARMAA